MLSYFFGPFALFGDGSGSGAAAFAPLPRTAETAWINNVAVEQLGMRLSRASQWLSSSATATPETLQAPGMTGGQIQPLRTTQPLQISLECVVAESALDARVDHVNRVADALRGAVLEIRFADAPLRVLYGTAGAVQVTPLTDRTFVPQKRSAGVRIAIPITCADGARYARHQKQIALTTALTPIRTGTLPSGGEILLFGAIAGDVDVECYAPTGALLFRHALVAASIASGGHLRIRQDVPRAIVAVSPTGVQTNAYALRDVAQSSRWWMVPGHVGDRARDSWCALRLSAGTGLIRYTDVWEH